MSSLITDECEDVYVDAAIVSTLLGLGIGSVAIADALGWSLLAFPPVNPYTI